MKALDRELLQQHHRSGQTFQYVFFYDYRKKPEGGVMPKQCLSQFYDSPFEVQGVSYPTAEHYMMASKARLFKDEAMLAKILHAETPGQAKKFGRQVRGYEDNIWKSNARRIVTEGNLAKFSANPEMKEMLLSTGDSVLVEASPSDCIWGIGLSETDTRASNPDTWRGQNLLGFALMDVRDELRKEA